MRKSIVVAVVFALALVLMAALPAPAQVVTATLSGHVQDSSGGALAGAEVTATNSATGFSRTSTASGEGEYIITALPAGNYTVSASSKGFKKEAKGITLQVGQAASLDLVLGVGGTTTQVTVQATTAVTEPTRTQISTVIQEHQIESLPVNGREFIDFALLSPAVQIGDTTSGSTDVIVEPVTKLSFAGQNIHFNFIAVDGADDISTVSGIQRGTPPQDSVQEFRVVNTNYTTDFGRAVGGIVNIVTKSGTNNWHGTAYEYFRNDVLDANSILAAPGLNTLRQNQFGAALGGPIKKDKTFFFGNYEGQRHGESPFYNSVILGNIGDSVNPAPGTINFVKKNVYGLPTEPARLNVLRTADTNNGFARLDHNFNDRETFMARYFVSQGTFLNQSPLNDGFDLPSGFKNNRINDQSLVGSLTSVITPNVVNQLRAQFARRSFDFKTATTQPHLEVANTFASGVNRGNPDFYLEKRFEVVDDLSITWAKNTISFGGNTNFVVSQESFPLFYPFEADFGSLGAYLGTDGAVAGCGTVTCPDPFVVFFERFQAPNFNEPTLANFAQIYAGQAIPSAIRNQAEGTINHTYNGLYVQDKWRATKDLTINYGLRWEFETWPSALLSNQYNNFDPRLGIAYRLGGNWNFTLRAGAGLFHGIIPSPLLGCQIPSCGGQGGYPGFPNLNNQNSRTELFAFASSPVLNNFALSQLLASGTYPDATTFSPFGPGGPCVPVSTCAFFGPATVVRFDKNHRNPYGIQSSLSLDFEPAKDTTVSISFLRVKGVHLGSFYNINQPTPQAQVAVHQSNGAVDCKNVYYAVGAPLVPNPGGPCGPGGGFLYPTPPAFAGFIPGTACELNGIMCPQNYAIYFDATSRWNSLFNGLLVNVNKRFSNHFSAEISYTFSHTIDDGPNPSFVLIPQDSGNFGAEKANSADDVRHRLVMNGVLASPTTGSMWWRDYQLSTIITLESPEYFTIFSGFDSNGDIFGNNDRVGAEGRDTFRGKNVYTFDLRGTRSFTFHEKQTLQFSAEAFNLFNHTNIKYFNTVYGSADFCNVAPLPAACGGGPFFRQGSPNPNYGTPRAVFNPRQIQLVLRYSW